MLILNNLEMNPIFDTCFTDASCALSRKWRWPWLRWSGSNCRLSRWTTCEWSFRWCALRFWLPPSAPTSTWRRLRWGMRLKTGLQFENNFLKDELFGVVIIRSRQGNSPQPILSKFCLLFHLFFLFPFLSLYHLSWALSALSRTSSRHWMRNWTATATCVAALSRTTRETSGVAAACQRTTSASSNRFRTSTFVMWFLGEWLCAGNSGIYGEKVDFGILEDYFQSKFLQFVKGWCQTSGLHF